MLQKISGRRQARNRKKAKYCKQIDDRELANRHQAFPSSQEKQPGNIEQPFTLVSVPDSRCSDLCVPSELLALLQAQHGTETAGKVKKIADPGCFMINRKILL